MTDLCGVSGGAGSFYERGRGRQAIRDGCPLTWCWFPYSICCCGVRDCDCFEIPGHDSREGASQSLCSCLALVFCDWQQHQDSVVRTTHEAQMLEGETLAQESSADW